MEGVFQISSRRSRAMMFCDVFDFPRVLVSFNLRKISLRSGVFNELIRLWEENWKRVNFFGHNEGGNSLVLGCGNFINWFLFQVFFNKYFSQS